MVLQNASGPIGDSTREITQECDVKVWLVSALFVVACAAQAAYGWPTVFPTGTTLYDPELAYNGYVLFVPMGEDAHVVRLIDMNGDVVHEWTFPLFQVIQSRLLGNGNLLVTGFDPQLKPGRPGVAGLWMGGVAGILMEVSWTNQPLFRHSDLNMHHDALKLPNGNYLYLAWEPVPLELQAKVRGGIKNSEHRKPPKSLSEAASDDAFLHAEKVMFNDVVFEINPRGKVVWLWEANKHLDPDVDIIGPVHSREEWGHANTLNVLANGNILLTSRTLDSILVIDKKTGNVIFRWGNMTRLSKESGELELIGKSTAQRKHSDTLSGPHGAMEIPRGVPGAGHFVVYDNGIVSRGALRASRAVEIDPGTGKLVWESIQKYNEMPVPFGRKHFSDFLGSAQKLPNGNMLLCDGANGRFFQMTADRQTVWEYVNPFDKDARFSGSVYKAYCYPPDYCPQFQEFLPAKGPAVDPAASDVAGGGRLTVRIGSKRIALSGIEILALSCVAAIVAFAVGRRWGRRRVVSELPGGGKPTGAQGRVAKRRN